MQRPIFQCRQPHDLNDYIDQDIIQNKQNSNNQTGLLGSALSLMTSTIKKTTQHIFYSFINLVQPNHFRQHRERNSRKPSQMTINLIRMIHQGFDPIHISEKRWKLQLEEEQKQHSQQINQAIDRIRDKKECNLDQQKKQKKRTIIKCPELILPKFKVNLWEIAQNNFQMNRRRLIQLEQKQKEKDMEKNKQSTILSQIKQVEPQILSQINAVQENQMEQKQEKQSKVQKNQNEGLKLPLEQKNCINQSAPIEVNTKNNQTDKEKEGSEQKQPLNNMENIYNNQVSQQKPKISSLITKNPFLSSPVKKISIMDLICQQPQNPAFKTQTAVQNQNKKQTETAQTLPKFTFFNNKLPENNPQSNIITSNQKQTDHIQQPTPATAPCPFNFSRIQKNNNSFPFNLAQPPEKQTNNNPFGIGSTKQTLVNQSTAPSPFFKPLSFTKKGLNQTQNNNDPLPSQFFRPQAVPTQQNPPERINFLQGISDQSLANQNIKAMFSSPSYQPPSLFGAHQRTQRKKYPLNKHGRGKYNQRNNSQRMIQINIMLAQGQQKIPKQQIHSNLIQIDPHSNAKFLKRQKIPKIGNKEIPLHNFGNTFTHLPLAKQKNYRSKLWSPVKRSARPQSEDKNSHYNRPEYLLKQYLERKQKILIQPLLINPEMFTENEAPFKEIGRTTTNDFRIKKKEKNVIYQPLFVESKSKPMQYNSEQLYSNINEDYMGFAVSKNIYDMTYEQLQQSIKWKKKFLQALNSKVRNTRTTSFQQRHKI